jgi:hypothetical protein
VHDRLRSLAVSDGRPIPSDAILDSVLDALDALEEVA